MISLHASVHKPSGHTSDFQYFDDPAIRYYVAIRVLIELVVVLELFDRAHCVHFFERVVTILCEANLLSFALHGYQYEGVDPQIVTYNKISPCIVPISVGHAQLEPNRGNLLAKADFHCGIDWHRSNYLCDELKMG